MPNTMRTSRRASRWLPIALCCIPGGLALAVMGVGLLTGGLVLGSGSPGGLLAVVALVSLGACSVAMGWMTYRSVKARTTPGSGEAATMDCCSPAESSASAFGESATERIHRLREQREAFERELAALQVDDSSP